MSWFRSPRMLVLVVGVIVLVGVGAAALGLVPRALEVRDYEREVARGFALTIDCTGAQECSAAATAERVSALRMTLASDDVSDRLEPIRDAYAEQLAAEAAFWRLQAARKAGEDVSSDAVERAEDAMVAAGNRRSDLTESVGGPLLPLFEE